MVLPQNLNSVCSFIILVCYEGLKYFDPAHIRTALHLIQSLSASENEAEQRLLENWQRVGLRVHSHTPADGNCFFHAVADQLSLLGLPHQSAAQLRNDVVLYLKYHPQIEVGKTYSLSPLKELVLLCILTGHLQQNPLSGL